VEGEHDDGESYELWKGVLYLQDRCLGLFLFLLLL
jgi:hypothetical protein